MIYQVKTDGTKRQMVSEDINNDMYYGLNVVGNWIYYLVPINEDDEIYDIYRIKTDGTGRKKITKKINVVESEINITGDWIFYLAFEKRGNNYDYVLYRMKTDGSNKKLVAK